MALGYESEDFEAMLLRRDSRVDAGSEAEVSSAVSSLFNLDQQNSSALLDDCPDLGFILSSDGIICRVSVCLCCGILCIYTYIECLI